MAEHWRLKLEVSWVQLPVTASFFTFLNFHLITTMHLASHFSPITLVSVHDQVLPQCSFLRDHIQYLFVGFHVREELGMRLFPIKLASSPGPSQIFILQPWRKIGRRPGIKTTSQTGNGGFGQYVTWTRFVLTKSTISSP